MNKIRVLIVDDSAFIRKVLKDILESDQNVEVIAAAKNGKEAIEFLTKQDVDVITLDVEMPVMNGIDTLKEIMSFKPTPVVMLSSLTNEGADMTFKALDLGAVDFVAKPTNIFKMSSSDIQDDIITKVKEAAKVKTKKMSLKTVAEYIPKEPMESSRNVTLTPRDRRCEDVKKIIAIGTSTGGPRALQEVISNVSGKIDAPVLVVQHMPKGFTKSLAERLNGLSQLTVKEAEDGEPLCNGTVYIAPGDRHIEIKRISTGKYSIKLSDGPKVSGHKPSVDFMFQALSESTISDVIAVVMTGMGSDGTKGIVSLKNSKKSYNIAEDESTCVVFGMPKAAISTGQIDKIVPLGKIAMELNKIMGV